MVFQLFTLAGAEALLISAHVITEYFQNFPTNVDFSARIKTFRGYIFCMIIIHLILWEINMSLSIIEPEICKIKSLKSKLGMLINIVFISDMHCLRHALLTSGAGPLNNRGYCLLIAPTTWNITLNNMLPTYLQVLLPSP